MKRIRGICLKDNGEEGEERPGIVIDQYTVPSLAEVVATLPEPEDGETLKDLMYRSYGLLPVITDDLAVSFFNDKANFDYSCVEEWCGNSELSEDLIVEAMNERNKMH